MRAIFGTKERYVIVIVTLNKCQIESNELLLIECICLRLCLLFCFCISMGEEEWLVGGKERSGSLGC